MGARCPLDDQGETIPRWLPFRGSYKISFKASFEGVPFKGSFKVSFYGFLLRVHLRVPLRVVLEGSFNVFFFLHGFL